ncbi:transposase, partial [Lactobacillus gallinarum]
TVTIKKTADDQFYLSMQLGSDTAFVKELPKTQSQIGIDLNLDNFLTASNGAMVANPRFYRKTKKKLAHAQRVLSRRQRRAKKEGRNLRLAKNYQKQRLAVAKLHDKIRRQRNDFLQVLSTALIKNHDLVVAEELRNKNLLKNHALSQAISDVGWRSFLNMLAYKADLYGK